MRLLVLAGLVALLATLLTLLGWKYPARRRFERLLERLLASYCWLMAIALFIWSILIILLKLG